MNDIVMHFVKCMKVVENRNKFSFRNTFFRHCFSVHIHKLEFAKTSLKTFHLDLHSFSDSPRYFQVYRGSPVAAVDHLCLGIPRGECFGLLGINGTSSEVECWSLSVV